MPRTEDTTVQVRPDRECPVCQSVVRFEGGYYDKKARYKCRRCGYEIKDTSMGFVIAVTVFALIVLSLIVAYMSTMFGPGLF